MKTYIEYLERKIEACDELGGLFREKAVYQSCLKEYRKQLIICASSTQLNNSFNVGEEIIYKSENYIIDFVDIEDKFVDMISLSSNDYMKNIPFKDLTKIV